MVQVKESLNYQGDTMATLFKNGRQQLRENPNVAMVLRMFRVMLLGGNPNSKIDPQNDVTLDDVFNNHRENARVGDVAARLQIIGDPTQPFGIRERLFQFFVEEGSRTTVRENFGTAVLYEATDGEKPIAFLNRDDLGATISGEGFTIKLPYDPEEAEPADPTPAPPAIEASDKDANSVADQVEYIDGDPDKGVRSDLGMERVGIVGMDVTPKPGTSAEENLANRPQGGAPSGGGSSIAATPSDTGDEQPAESDEAALSEEELERQADEAGESTAEDGPGVISTITRPTVLAEQFTRSELQQYAQENEIAVKRQDGGSGQPLESDYARDR